MRILIGALPLALAVVAGTGGWKRAAPLAAPRTEVAAALLGGLELAVAGGYLLNGANSARVDAYSPSKNRWRATSLWPRTS